MNLHCKVCLCSRSGDILGAQCQTPHCTGIIEVIPAFATLVEVLPETMTCPRRSEGPHDQTPGVDRWERFKSNGDRVCSFCGSLHPDDFLAMVKVAADAPEDAAAGAVPSIDPSDKGYKIYVRRTGVRNAHEGGIKFYTHHLPTNAAGEFDLTAAQKDEYPRAVRASRARFERRPA